MEKVFKKNTLKAKNPSKCFFLFDMFLAFWGHGLGFVELPKNRTTVPSCQPSASWHGRASHFFSSETGKPNVFGLAAWRIIPGLVSI